MIQRMNMRDRRDDYGSRINRDHSPVLAYALPWLTVMIASLLPVFAVATALPLVPPLGFLVLLGWRLVRPGLFPVWAGFPLGLWDDLFSGQPFGSAMALWSVSMIAIEIIETRFPWRSFLHDWGTIAIVLAAYLAAAMVFSGASMTIHMLDGVALQLLLSILLFPIIARMVARLDRFRLMRIRTIG